MKSGEEIKKESDNSISWSEFWRGFWLLIKPFKRLAFQATFLILIMVPFGIAKPYILKLIIDGFFSLSQTSFFDFAKLVALYFACDEVRSFLQYLADRRILRLEVDVEYSLYARVQEKMLFLNLGYHEMENTGAKTGKIDRGVGKVTNFLESIFWEVLPTVFQLIFAAVALFYTDWRIGLSLLFFAPIFITVTILSNRRMYPIRKKIYADYEKAGGKMVQSIININAVQSFVQEDNELSSYSAIRRSIRDNWNKQWAWMMKVGLSRNIIVDTGRATVIFLGAYLVFKGLITPGSLIFAMTLSETTYASLYRLTRFYDRIEEGRVGVSRLISLLNDEDGLERKKKAYVPKKVEGGIKFENVSFHYNEGKELALDNVNFKIFSGSTTAFIGPSGGGKTTVARLIYRHYDPQSGGIFLDDKNLRDYDLRGFRKFMAIVPQEVEIFDLSVAENISYAKPDASREEIAAAAKIANADGFISRLESGYDTLVGERGVKLSGGQRQRVGIARAVLANPRVLIFDEATSNLDSESERLIQLAMKKISKGRTMIIIAHRLSTVRQADKIIVLEKGKVVESGRHSELANVDGGLYARLLKLQMSGDIKDV